MVRFRYDRLYGICLIVFGVTHLTGGFSGAVERPVGPQDTCVTAECHGDYTEQPYVHGPVSLGDCKGCHKPVDPQAHTYQMAREGRDLCEYCHLDQATATYVHEPLTEKGCLECHDPHSSEGKGLIKAKTVAELCATCHDVTEGVPYLHGPTAVGECSVCHNPHTSDFNDLLTVEPKELCTSCHVITKEELTKFEFVHEPAQGDCVGCHDPHGANSMQMLKAETPQMCYACHEDIQNLAENAKHKHNVVREAGGCLKCHTPHASTVRYLLQNDPATLCMDCHDEPVGLDTNEVLPAFTQEIKDRKFLHGPVQDKSCSGCHSTHGSDHFRLLAKAYPSVFYSPYTDENYDLCYSCHEKTVVQTEFTTELTDFRNGDLNLHFLHVHKAKRGRTCRACHQTHASDLPKHIREKVPYGIWELPIGFVKQDAGGSCSPGCHLPMDYHREEPVDYEAIRQEKTVTVWPKAQP